MTPNISPLTKGDRPICISVTSDHHCGSTIALCPPEGTRLDDGGTYRPGVAQRWIWDNWTDYWAWVEQERAKVDGIHWSVLNGDLYEGEHHGTHQTITKAKDPIEYVAGRVFGVMTALNPEHIFVVRGTRAHVGVAASAEEARAKILGAERDNEAKTWSWWQLPLIVHGLFIDFQHHPGTRGTRPWTSGAGMSRLAYYIWSEYAQRGRRAPDLAIRSHFHNFGDSGDNYPVLTRAIITPSWQLKSEHAHKVVPEAISDIGGILIIVNPDGSYEVKKKLYEVAPPKPWREEKVWTQPQAKT